MAKVREDIKMMDISVILPGLTTLLNERDKNEYFLVD